MVIPLGGRLPPSDSQQAPEWDYGPATPPQIKLLLPPPEQKFSAGMPPAEGQGPAVRRLAGTFFY